MALSPVALSIRALLKVGAAPIVDFEDGTVEAELARNLYPLIRDALLSSHPWNFATAQSRLPRLPLPPRADHACAFRLPADFLRALSLGGEGRGRGLVYRIVEDCLHCDHEAVTLTYIFRPPEIAFPPFFDYLLVTRLAAEFCLPMTESTSRSEALFAAAEGELRRARLIDAQQDTPAGIEDFTLVGVRG